MSLFGHRSIGKLIGACFEKRHYAAFFNMAMKADPFGDVLYRYLTGRKEYPYQCRVETPTGVIKPTLYSYYDLLTLNEVFFREDYKTGNSPSVIVDIGSNIGLSALYFLTRHESSRVYLFEPDPRNVQRLKDNLKSHASRYVLEEKAVADQTGMVRFGLDVTSGRYGGLKVDFGQFMMVDCVHINTILKGILEREKVIDILKIDTEGTEIETIAAIDKEFLPRIQKIYIEAEPTVSLHTNIFEKKQYGTVCQLTNIIHQI